MIRNLRTDNLIDDLSCSHAVSQVPYLILTKIFYVKTCLVKGYKIDRKKIDDSGKAGDRLRKDRLEVVCRYESGESQKGDDYILTLHFDTGSSASRW